ncbi:hypothetical protein ABZS52_18670 [Micromonospora profundi]|uniref:hypothetical protein n=1 Tax=Micromonospora profundi TaxID=1420889 RepID=UPI0033B41421
MTKPVIVDPDKLRQFGSAEGAVFCLVTNPEFKDDIVIAKSGRYDDYLTVPLHRGERFEDILSRIPEPSHIFGVSPAAFFESPSDEVLGPRRKVLAMACNSTPTTLDEIRHFLDVMERTSPEEQDGFSDTFFELLEESDHLVYVDAKRNTTATLQHLDETLVWNQQAGAIGWGEQQIVPAGEISVLPIDIREFEEDLHLPLEGEITIRGYPILHSGTPSFSRADQQRIYQELSGLRQHAVVARVENGVITDIRPDSPGAQRAVDMLNAMFEVDSRYRIVWEMGHALNTALEIIDGNHAMNETYGATHGCLHWGLGLTPYTQYHLDIISPDTTVRTSNGIIVLGVDGGYDTDRIATGL